MTESQLEPRNCSNYTTPTRFYIIMHEIGHWVRNRAFLALECNEKSAELSHKINS